MRLSFAYQTPVRQLQKIMNSLDFAKCLAYARIEPIGDKRGDFQAASIVAAVKNSIGGNRVSINDQLLNFNPQQQQTQDEMYNLVLQTLPKE